MRTRSLSTLLIILLSVPLMAEHLPGGSITYKCLGGSFYEIKLSLLRECSGFAMQPQTLSFTNDCGVQFQVADMQHSSVEDVSQICPSQLANSTCQGGELAGFELYHYTTELFLSPCDGWTIFWSICCRQESVNVQMNPGLYIETKLNNLTDTCSSSPVFTHNNVPHVCIGEEVFFNSGATDPDGHSLQYTFIDARFASPFPVSVNYVFPNYGGEPVAGMTLDPTTGEINFTPTTQGYIIVVVQVEEFNADGELLGMVMRDFPFIVYNCDNAVPDPDSGGITATSGGVNSGGPHMIDLCIGSSGCATLSFTDPDAGDQLSFTTDLQNVFPDAVFTTTDIGTAQICWTVIEATPGTYQFFITATDDHCPITGSTDYGYTVNVIAGGEGESGIAHACSLTLPFALIDSLPGTVPENGVWSGPQGAAHSGFFDNANDGPGTYSYSIGAGACTMTYNLEIVFLPENDPACIISSIERNETADIQLHPNPTTGIIHFDHGSFAGPILISDETGRVVQEIPASPQQTIILLDPMLENGSYLLQMRTPGGVVSRRIILQR